MCVLNQAPASLKVFIKLIQFDIMYEYDNLHQINPDTVEMNHVLHMIF